MFSWSERITGGNGRLQVRRRFVIHDFVCLRLPQVTSARLWQLGVFSGIRFVLSPRRQVGVNWIGLYRRIEIARRRNWRMMMDEVLVSWAVRPVRFFVSVRSGIQSMRANGYLCCWRLKQRQPGNVERNANESNVPVDGRRKKGKCKIRRAREREAINRHQQVAEM